MAKFKYISLTDGSLITAERWVPEKGTTVDGVEETLDPEGQPVGYHTVDGKGNRLAVYSGDYIVPDGNGYRPHAAAIFPVQFNGILPRGRVLPAEFFVVLDLVGALLEELMPGSGVRWEHCLESMYANPEKARQSFQLFIDHLKSQGADTGTLEEAMLNMHFFDPAAN